MIIYNVTVSIDPDIESDWLQWMRKTHIPDVMNTQCFRESRISRVHGEEAGGLTYAITYVARSQESYDQYQRDYAPALQADHTHRYAGKFAAFRTELTLIEEFSG